MPRKSNKTTKVVESTHNVSTTNSRLRPRLTTDIERHNVTYDFATQSMQPIVSAEHTPHLVLHNTLYGKNKDFSKGHVRLSKKVLYITHVAKKNTAFVSFRILSGRKCNPLLEHDFLKVKETKRNQMKPDLKLSQMTI